MSSWKSSWSRKEHEAEFGPINEGLWIRLIDALDSAVQYTIEDFGSGSE